MPETETMRLSKDKIKQASQQRRIGVAQDERCREAVVVLHHVGRIHVLRQLPDQPVDSARRLDQPICGTQQGKTALPPEMLDRLDHDRHQRLVAAVRLGEIAERRKADLLVGVEDPRRDEILQTASFPAELEQNLTQVVESSSWDWATAWREFERLGQELAEKKWRLVDHRRMRVSVESLARRPNAQPSEVLQLLRRRFRGYNKSLMQWLEPQLVELAGEMRLTEAVPLLIDRLAEDDEQVADAAITALTKIGGDEIVRAIQKEWLAAHEEMRQSMGDVLEHLRSDLCLRACLALLPEEDDPDTAITLGHAIVSQFTPEAIEPVRELVQGEADDLDPEIMGLRQHLVAAAAIMEVSFLEFDQWLQEAQTAKWGWGEFGLFRLAENFREDSGSEGELPDDEDDGEEFGGPAEIEYVRTRRLDADESCPCEQRAKSTANAAGTKISSGSRTKTATSTAPRPCPLSCGNCSTSSERRSWRSMVANRARMTCSFRNCRIRSTWRRWRSRR
jgi:HEAT repeat protein